MIRSIVTASYVAESTGLPLHAWTDIHERGGLHEIDPATGEETGAAGPNRAFFAAEYPDLVLPDEVGEKGWWSRPPEDVDASFPRALRVWEAMVARHGDTDDRVAIVSHGGFFQSLLVTLLGMDDASQFKTPTAGQIWFGMSNTAISRVEIADGNGVVRYINRVDHLPPDLITG